MKNDEELERVLFLLGQYAADFARSAQQLSPYAIQMRFVPLMIAGTLLTNMFIIGLLIGILFKR